MTTNTTSPASQAPEVLTKQVAAWRAEVARLNDLIAFATGASQAPAVSIDSDPEFQRRHGAWIEGREYFQDDENPTVQADWMAFIAHIDAKLAQAESRATAAEAKLEAMRQGVEGLKRYFPAYFEAEDLPKEGQFESPMLTYANGEWLKRDDVLALLQPQPQADESGLPG